MKKWRNVLALILGYERKTYMDIFQGRKIRKYEWADNGKAEYKK